MPRNIKDMRLIYIMIFAVIFVSSIAPQTLPIPVQQWTRDFYKVITTGATNSWPTATPPTKTFTGVTTGTRVFFAASGEVDKLWGDMSEGVLAVWKDLYNRGANLLLWYSGPSQEATLTKYMLPLLFGTTNLPTVAGYGTRFVNLGYVVGGSQLLQQWAEQGISTTITTDAYGTPLSTLPMMSNFNVLKTDADLIIGLDARDFDKIFVIRYNTIVLQVGSTDSSAYVAQSYTVGYFRGMVMGQIGAAQYSFLSGVPGAAMAYAQNMLTLGSIMIVLMIVFNIKYRMDLSKKQPIAKEAKS